MSCAPSSNHLYPLGNVPRVLRHVELEDFNIVDECVEVLFSDNGIGVDLEKFTKESIFDPGVTDRRGGSGIGLSTILNRMDKDLNGEIEFVGNGIKFPTGATFKLKFF